jgi:hypothetical protein
MTNFRSGFQILLRAGCCVAALLVPGLARASDTVHALRQALMIAVGDVEPDLEAAKQRYALVEAAVAKLKSNNSIGELRTAYFLDKWGQHIRLPGKVQPVLPFRAEIGKLLEGAIRAAAKNPNADVRLALTIQIAEMADSEASAELAPREFSRSLTDVVVTLTGDMNSIAVRQGALHALGKITPDPDAAFAVIKKTLQTEPKLGPRRLAAYAITDLAKNSRTQGREKLARIVELAFDTGAAALKDAPALEADPHDAVRGYVMQGLGDAAKALSDFVAPQKKEALTEKNKAGNLVLMTDLKKTFQAIQAAQPQVAAALRPDRTINVRLTALLTMSHIGQARLNLAGKLDEDNRDRPRTVLDRFEAPDPFERVLSRDAKKPDAGWQDFAKLLARGEDVRLRRGGMELIELLRDGAAVAANDIATALGDDDLFVAWAAARTIRYLNPKDVRPDAMQALIAGLSEIFDDRPLKDRSSLTRTRERDPNLSKAAIEAIERLGETAVAAGDALAGVLGNKAGGWDVETRVAAMKALVSIGKAGQRAVLIDVLTDTDVRIRREAAVTVGRFVRPSDPLAERAMSALTRALGDDDAEVRLNAAEAILNIGTRKQL